MLQIKSFKLDTHPNSLCYISIVADESAKHGTVFKRIVFISYNTIILDIELPSENNLGTFTFTGKYSRTTSRQVTWFMHEWDRRFDTENIHRVVQQIHPLTLTIGEEVAKEMYEMAKYYWSNGSPLNPDSYYRKVAEAMHISCASRVNLLSGKEVQHDTRN